MSLEALIAGENDVLPENRSLSSPVQQVVLNTSRPHLLSNDPAI